MSAEGQAPIIEYSKVGHHAIVALNRPHVLNAVSTPLLRELIATFERINEASDIWCAVVKGNGRAFCVGADQKERVTMSLDDVRRRRRIALVAFAAAANCEKPVIAQVHGYALGSGLEIALGCDIVVADETTVMGLIETKLGATPGGGGTQLLPRLIGPSRTKELIFTGRKFSAKDAAQWGMINYAVPGGLLEDKVSELVEEVISAAPIAVTQTKHAIRMSGDIDLATGFQVEAALYERIMHTWDRNEALAAYAEHRAPNFEAR